VNAGHGLNKDNIRPFIEHVPYLDEISIGHALMADALFRGIPACVREMCDILNSYEASGQHYRAK
jgi:pyridoxine 5-phosphate synthase